MNEIGLRPFSDNVPCNGCIKCCQWDAIFIHAECGDDETQYETVMFNGRKKLANKPNGDCVYLDRQTGCTIHGHAPVICREFDCRVSVPMVEAQGIAHLIPKKVRKQAHKMIKKSKELERRRGRLNDRKAKLQR